MQVSPVGRVRPTRVVSFLVDSGAVYSVLPERVWKALRLRPKDRMTFSLARFVYRGTDRVSPVILGEGKDDALLGAVTLETLGLVLNPLSRELQPMRLLVAGLSG
jgi:predicted aspartyl protease